MRLKPLLLSAALAIGIASTVPAAGQTIASKIENLGNARYINVSSLMAKERNGFLTLQFELSSTSSYPRRAFWRIKWLDESGFQVWDDETWKPITIQGEARQNVQTTAPTPKAKDFRIQFNAEENSFGNNNDSTNNSN
jgi:hypothetical protein